MATSKFILALLSGAIIAVPAMAQTTTAPRTTTTPMTTTPMSTTAPMPTGHIDASKWMTTEQGGWRASKLKGVNVYNNSNEKIGDIEELMLDNTGRIVAVVIGVGGFLGMGEHNVAVPFSDLKFVSHGRAVTGMAGTATTTTMPATSAVTTGHSNTDATTAAESYPDRVILDQTKDQLKAAPQFKYHS
jgi:sporulation protein YlmC with PRC-barrel domain